MTTFTVKRKCFSLFEYTRGADGKIVRGKMLAEGASAGGSVQNMVANTGQAAKAEAAEAARQAAHKATSEALKPVQGKVNQVAAKARTAGYNTGFKAGGTFGNAWKNTSNLGKAGVVGGAALLGGLAVKGLNIR